MPWGSAGKQQRLAGCRCSGGVPVEGQGAAQEAGHHGGTVLAGQQVHAVLGCWQHVLLGGLPQLAAQHAHELGDLRAAWTAWSAGSGDPQKHGTPSLVLWVHVQGMRAEAASQSGEGRGPSGGGSLQGLPPGASSRPGFHRTGSRCPRHSGNMATHPCPQDRASITLPDGLGRTEALRATGVAVDGAVWHGHCPAGGSVRLLLVYSHHSSTEAQVTRTSPPSRSWATPGQLPPPQGGGLGSSSGGTSGFCSRPRLPTRTDGQPWTALSRPLYWAEPALSTSHPCPRAPLDSSLS